MPSVSNTSLFKFAKRTGELTGGAVKSYIVGNMETVSDIASTVRSDAKSLSDIISTNTGNLRSRIKQLSRQNGIKEIQKWFYDNQSDDNSGDQFGSTDFDIDVGSSEIQIAQIDAEERSAKKITKTIMDTSSKMVESQIATTASMLTSIDKLSSITVTGFDNVNATLNKILEVVTKNTASIIGSMDGPAKGQSAKDQMISGWKFNANDYKKMVGSNLQGTQLGMLASMMSGGGGMIKDFLSPQNLANMGLDWLTGKATPNLKGNMKALDEAVNSMIMDSLIRLGERNDFLGGFGIKTNNERISTTRSELSNKAVSFDSVTREYITNGIPEYMRRILVQLGGDDVIFDAKSRTMKTSNQLKRAFYENASDGNTIGRADDNVRRAFKGNINASNKHGKEYGRFVDLAYDLIMEDMGSSSSAARSRTNTFGSKSTNKEYVTDLLKGTNIASGNEDFVDLLVEQLRRTDNTTRQSMHRQAMRQRVNRDSRLTKSLADADQYGQHTMDFDDDDRGRTSAILGRHGQSTIGTNKDTVMTGMGYTHNVLYEIYRRLNKGINVFQVGSSEKAKGPYSWIGDIKAPGKYKERPIKDAIGEGSSFSSRIGSEDRGANMLLDDEVLDSEGNPVLDESGNPVKKTTGQKLAGWGKKRGRALSGALFSGNADDVKAAFGNIVADIGGVGSDLAKKWLVGDGEGKEGAIGKAKKKMNDWLTDASKMFNYGDDEDGGKAKKHMLASGVGAVAGMGLLGGPIGLMVGAMAGNAISVGNFGGKIKNALFGEKGKGGEKTKDGIIDKIFNPLKTATGKIFKGADKFLKDKILGPISDVGYAVKEGALGAIYDSVLAPVGRALKGVGNVIMIPFKLLGKSVMAVARGAKAFILNPMADLFKTGKNVLFGGKGKDADGNEIKYEGLFPTLFKNTIGVAASQLSKTMSNIGGSVKDKILDPLSDMFFVMKEKMKKSTSNFILGTKDKDGNYSGGLLSGFANKVSSVGDTIKDKTSKFFTNVFKNLGESLKTAIASPFALLRVLNPLSGENVYSAKGRSAISERWGATEADEGRGGLNRISKFLMGVGTDGGSDGDNILSSRADAMAGDDDDIMAKLNARRSRRSAAREGRAKLAEIRSKTGKNRGRRLVSEAEEAAIETTENTSDIADATERSASAAEELLRLGSEEGSIFTHDAGMHRKMDELIAAIRGEKSPTGSQPTATPDDVGVVTHSSDSSPSGEGDIIGGALQAASTIATEGPLSNDDEQQFAGIVDEASSAKPNKRSVMSKIKDLFKSNKKESDEEGSTVAGKKKGLLASILGELPFEIKAIGIGLGALFLKNPNAMIDLFTDVSSIVSNLNEMMPNISAIAAGVAGLIASTLGETLSNINSFMKNPIKYLLGGGWGINDELKETRDKLDTDIYESILSSDKTSESAKEKARARLDQLETARATEPGTLSSGFNRGRESVKNMDTDYGSMFKDENGVDRSIGDIIGYMYGVTAEGIMSIPSGLKKIFSGPTRNGGGRNTGNGPGAYYQNSYSDSLNMRSAGCGPIVSSYLAKMYGGDMSPTDAASALNMSGYRDASGGTTSAGIAAMTGLTATSSVGAALDSVRNGKPAAILGRSEGSGPYTKSGHFIVAESMDSNGNVTVMDPLSPNKKKYSADTLMDGAKSAVYAKGYGVGENNYLEKHQGFPYYRQGGSSPWANADYGGNTMANSACGPTSMAMVLAGATGTHISPLDVANWSVKHGYRVPNAGTSWGLFGDIGKEEGLTVNVSAPSQSAIDGMLSSGKPVIMTGRAPSKESPFTSGGHYVVAVGKQGDKYLINDPAGISRSGAYTWDQISQSKSNYEGVRQMWGFSKDGKGILDASYVPSGTVNIPVGTDGTSGSDSSSFISKVSSSLSELGSKIQNQILSAIGLAPSGSTMSDSSSGSFTDGGITYASNTPGGPAIRVTLGQMVQLGWNNITQGRVNELNNCLSMARINNINVLCHFLAQCSHESACGRYTVELGDKAYCSKYEGRQSLGNTEPGDGYKFKGAGYIQLTGRYNYTKFAQAVGDANIVNQGAKYVGDNYPWTSAFFWWNMNGMTQKIESGKLKTVKDVTLKVNGGTNGLSERERYYKKAVDIFSKSSAVNMASSNPDSTLPADAAMGYGPSAFSMGGFGPDSDIQAMEQLEAQQHRQGNSSGNMGGTAATLTAQGRGRHSKGKGKWGYGSGGADNVSSFHLPISSYSAGEAMSDGFGEEYGRRGSRGYGADNSAILSLLKSVLTELRGINTNTGKSNVLLETLGDNMIDQQTVSPPVQSKTKRTHLSNDNTNIRSVLSIAKGL